MGASLEGRSSLVGRQAELAQVWQRYRAAAAGRTKVVALAGEPGIGKTALLSAIAGQAAARGACVLRGGASQAEGMPPYLPFVEALGSYVGAAPAAQLRRVAGPYAASLITILPELSALPDLPAGAAETAPPEQARLRLYEAVGALLADIARGEPAADPAPILGPEPLVLILDDLHWADAASLDLLCHVVRRRPDGRLLILAAYREDEVDDSPALRRALVELSRLRALDVIAVARLDPTGTAALAHALLDGPLDPQAAQLLHAQGEGNPFFIEELLRSWLDAGLLAPASRRWCFTYPPSREPPATVREAVAQRVARLPDGCVDLLRTAAVIGRSFEAAFLAQVLGRDEEAVEAELVPAVRARLILDRGDGTPVFSHDLVRECLYEQVTPARRRRLHGYIGRVLEERPGSAGARRLADLAYHFAHSGDRERGARYAWEGAGQAALAYAWEEALALYQTALDLTPDGDTRRGELLMQLGEVALLAERPQAAIEALGAAASPDGSGRAAAWEAHALHALGRAYWRIESLPEARGALEWALARSPAEDGAAVVRILVDLATLLGVSLHELDEGIALARQALETATRLGDRALMAAAGRTAGNLLVRFDHLGDGMPLLEQALALAQQAGDAAETAECCACLGNAYVWSGAIAETEPVLATWRASAQSTHDLFQLRHVYTLQAWVHWHHGEHAAVPALLAQAREVVEQLQSPEPLAFFEMANGLYAYERGLLDEAALHLEAGIAIFRSSVPDAPGWYLGLLGVVYALQERRDEARACQAEVEAQLALLPVGSMSCGEPLTHLTMIALELGDHAAVLRYAPRLLPYRGQHHDAFVDRLLAAAAVLEGRWETAAEFAASAREQSHRAGHLLEQAYVEMTQADLELGRGGPGSARRARTALLRALELCEATGNAHEVRRVRRRLRELPRQPGARGTPALAGLSGRELEILRLIAQGESNRSIAEGLGLSEKTVANHVTHIFNKTGAGNRASLAAFGVRHGLA